MPRVAASPSNELQSKWASLWYLQKAQGTLQEREQPTTSLRAVAPPIVNTDHRESPDPAPPSSSNVPVSDNSHFSYSEPTAGDSGQELLGAEFEEVSPWSRAVRALRGRLRLKDVLLIVIAATLAFGVVSAWPSSGGQLTWFQSILVRLGRAQTASHTPVHAGNPNVNVWVDVHTALYYCAGADLYGKTPDGHFAAQVEALQQNFEPAAGLACQ